MSQRPDRTRDRRPVEQFREGRGGEQTSGEGRGAESQGPAERRSEPRGNSGQPGWRAGWACAPWAGSWGCAHLGPAHLAALTWAAHGAAVTASGRRAPSLSCAEHVPAGRGRPLPPPEGRAAERAQPRPRAAGLRLTRPSTAGGTVKTRDSTAGQLPRQDPGQAPGSWCGCRGRPGPFRVRRAERSRAEVDQHPDEPAGQPDNWTAGRTGDPQLPARSPSQRSPCPALPSVQIFLKKPEN